jgi:hypothetical protein
VTSNIRLVGGPQYQARHHFPQEKNEWGVVVLKFKSSVISAIFEARPGDFTNMNAVLHPYQQVLGPPSLLLKKALVGLNVNAECLF